MEDTDRKRASLAEAVDAMNAAAAALDALAHRDLGGLHVDAGWSAIPYPDDHLAFVRDQLLGLAAALREGPPDVGPRVVVAEPEPGGPPG